MNESRVDVHAGFEMDGLTGYMVYTCPSCGKNRHPAAGLHPGTRVSCRCGKTKVIVKGDGLDKLQRGLDDLRRALQPRTIKIGYKIVK
jgi:DNA-directed RNA polymerase subunit RPC12/RpoP